MYFVVAVAVVLLLIVIAFLGVYLVRVLFEVG